MAVPIDTEASTLAAAVARLVPGKTILGASILLESFKGLGLQRPVRKYERIRDIMNGWEDDTRNTLILISSLSGGEGLNATDAPAEPQNEAANWLYYMVKPGKWTKRWIVLRGGSILLAKKESAKKEKDFTHLFHLSDFDVYDPNSTTASNILKCPKRNCFAVKSQQKASLFQNTSDWVHYFATNDKNIATMWQALLRSWRSYHLVYVKGYGEVPDGDKKDSSESEQEDKIARVSDRESLLERSRSTMRPKTSGASSDTSGRKKYTPLISAEELLRPPQAVGSSIRRSKSLKISGRHGSLTNAPPVPAPPKDEEVFAPTGLLGRTYTKKVKDMHDSIKDDAFRQMNTPLFTPASAMANLANGVPVRTNSTAHRRASSIESVGEFDLYRAAHTQLLQRQKSVSKQPQMGRPLLEFSDSELTHPRGHQQRQRSRTLVGGTPGPLISGATSPMTYETPTLPNPSSALWNKPRSRPPTRDHEGANPLLGNPFTGTGLLAYSNEGAGAIRTGHGVSRKMDQGAFLDMSHQSIFAQGSLLAKVERERPVEGPLIDRTGGADTDEED